jgi:hypothetical protein
VRVYTFNESLQNGDDMFSTIRLIDLRSKTYMQREDGDFFRNIRQNHPWSEPYAPLWKSPKFSFISINQKPFLDMGKLGISRVEIFSQKAVDLIGKDLLADGEFLPLELTGAVYESHRTKKGAIELREVPAASISKELPTKYYWFRVLKNLDLSVLKLDSAMGFTNDPTDVPYLEKYDFNVEKLEGINLFYIVGHRGNFVTGTLVDLIRKFDLKGFDFQLIWDSENPDYIDERFKPEVWAEIKSRHAKRN